MDRVETNMAAAAAKGTITLGGKTFLVHPPTPQDMQTVGKYLRDLMMKPLKYIAAELEELPESLQRKVIDAALDRKFSVDRLPKTPEQQSQAMAAMLTTPEGVRFLVWTLTRRDHPQCTLESFRELITDANALDVLQEATEAAGMDRLGNSVGPYGP